MIAAQSARFYGRTPYLSRQRRVLVHPYSAAEEQLLPTVAELRSWMAEGGPALRRSELQI
jgi:hypothetical protein